MDLVLNGFLVGGPSAPLDPSIRDALREHGEHDLVNSVQLWNERPSVLEEVLAALTPNEAVVRKSSIGTIALRLVDASSFMSRVRFPKLTYLRLSTGSHVTDWERVGQLTTALTTLALTFENYGIPTLPTIAQLLSLLASNPGLQDISLYRLRTSHTAFSSPSTCVPMRNLQRLSVDSELRSMSEVIKRVAYPNNIEHISITAVKCGVDSILTTLGGLARDHFLREGRAVGEQGISLQCFPKLNSLQVSSYLASDDQPGPSSFSRFTANLRHLVPRDEFIQPCTDFVLNVPGEEVVFFRGELEMDIIRRVVPTMPNITDLYLVGVQLQPGFLQPEHIALTQKFLPSLGRLCLDISKTVGSSTIVEDTKVPKATKASCPFWRSLKLSLILKRPPKCSKVGTKMQ